MWRFLLPAFFAMTVALILLFAGVRGDAQSAPGVSERVGDIVGNAAPSHASPPLPTPAPSPFAQGPTVSGVVEQPQEARDARDDRATDLRHQVSDLQDLVAQVNQQLAQRKAQNPAAATGGQQGPPDAPQADDLQRQDGELHKELQGLITQLEQELQLEEQSPPVADVAEQQERQAARDALRHEIADLHREDNEVQGLMAHPGRLSRNASPIARHPLAPTAPRTPASSRPRATRSTSIRLRIYGARLPICSDRMTLFNTRSPRASKSLAERPGTRCGASRGEQFAPKH